MGYVSNWEYVKEHEVRIEWEQEPEQYDYVRASTQPAGTRQRPVQEPVGERIGYGVLDSNAPNSGNPGVFIRRVFWLKEGDRVFDPTGVYESGCPSEAVDPRTVAVGVRGDKTDRVRYGTK